MPLVSAWRATLLATGKSGGEAIPHLAERFRRA